MHVNGARDGPDLLGHVCRQSEIVWHVVTDDLNIDWRREAEVQDLRDDVCRLKEERSGRKVFWQLLTEFFDISGRWMMPGLKRYQDLGVEVADRFAVAVGEVDSACRQADIVENTSQLGSRNDAADHVFGFAGNARGFFDSSAGRSPQMKTQLSGVDRGEEVLPQPGDDQRNARDAEYEEASHKHFAVIQAKLKQIGVASAQRLKAVFKGVMNAGEDAAFVALDCVLVGGRFFLHQVHHKGRHQGPGEKVGSKQREDDGLGQRHEQIPLDSSQEEHGHEHDADRQSRDHGGNGGLVRSIEDGLPDFLFHRHLAFDILDLN